MTSAQKSIRVACAGELADMLFSSTVPIMANVLVTAIAAAALLYERPSILVVVWALSNAATCGLRIAQSRSYWRHRHEKIEPQVWMRRNAWLVAATGLHWGVLGLVAPPFGGDMNNVMVPVLIFAISASIASTHTAHLPAIRACIYPSCLLLAVGQVIAGGAAHIVVACLALIFLVNLDLVIRRGHRVVVQTLLAKLARERSQAHLARAQRVAATGSAERDLVAGTEEWSEEMYRLWGIDPQNFSFAEDSILATIHPEDRERVELARVLQRAGQRTRPGEFRVIRPDGEVKTLYVEIDLERDYAGQPVRVLSIVKDVTELRAVEQRQRATEAQLLHAQKLEAMGTLAGGVAHELNNTLVPVLSLAKLTIKRLPEGSREQSNLVTILRSAERARDLVERVVAFSRQEMSSRVEIDIAELTRHALGLLRDSLPATITLMERIGPVPPILGDPAQLPQLVLNLVMNAVQATTNQTGAITIELAAADGEELPHDPASGPSPAIRLSVIDHGCGMDYATRARIFEPFFTTKGVGEGIGLGLSVVHGIVTQHGGRIAVESEPSQGARFDVYLPALAVSRAQQVEAAAAQ